MGIKVVLYFVKCDKCSKILYALNEKQARANYIAHYKLVHDEIPKQVSVLKREVEVEV